MSLKICHWFQASGANQHLHVFQVWSPPPSNTVGIIVGMPSNHAAYDGLRLWYLNKYTEELANTGDTNCNCTRFFKIREIVLLLNHPKVLLTPTENRRQDNRRPQLRTRISQDNLQLSCEWPDCLTQPQFKRLCFLFWQHKWRDSVFCKRFNSIPSLSQ